METVKSFSLPKLPYDYKALEPYVSEQQLTLHHDKHHLAYVNGANAILEKLEKARKKTPNLTKSHAKELSFHIGGHILHSIFWDNLAPAGKGGGKQAEPWQTKSTKNSGASTASKLNSRKPL